LAGVPVSDSDVLVLFDFNGVIADDEAVHQEMLQRILTEEGITVTDAEYHEIYLGFDDKGCFTEAYTRNGREITDDQLADLIHRKSAIYDAYIAEHLVLFPGAAECVHALADVYPLGIVSGALAGEIEAICDKADLSDDFVMVVSAEDTEACKPHPEGYLKAVALFNLYLAEQGRRMEPGQCVVIEDSIAGVQSAKAAGMKCVAITHSYQADELAEADRIIDKMADFTPQLVQELMGA
jgi:HAD superfamily hydrolase (TIGR01509 family)